MIVKRLTVQVRCGHAIVVEHDCVFFGVTVPIRSTLTMSGVFGATARRTILDRIMAVVSFEPFENIDFYRK